MTESVAVEQWSELGNIFSHFFDGLGEVSCTNEVLNYQSLPPGVPTVFAIHRDGRVDASMPLHGIEAIFEFFEFDASDNNIVCQGQHGKYTYRVPEELLRLRSDSA
ncbi:MAG: hypothetical protein OSA38_07445 [Candidatus Poseidoniaceae archaeon]|nr:hypothetical protein [Candidatus Poseidoniaceae archaeon]